MREICESCGKRQARLRFTEISGGQRSTAQLCEQCGEERGLPSEQLQGGRMDTRKIWDEIVQRLSDRSDEEGSLACPDCGLTFGSFESEGFLGCPVCYQTFMGDMTRLLREYHGSDSHQGKMPRSYGRRIDLRRRILGVKENIQLAINAERFEDAARLRDEMRDLESEFSRIQAGGQS